MSRITPFLWFNDQAEQAADLYVSIFKNSRILEVKRYGAGSPFPAGTAMAVTLELEGVRFVALNGGPHYQLSPAFSFLVDCETQAEVDRLWDALVEGGAPSRCGWLVDRFGLSWQIVPSILLPLLLDPDPVRAGRVNQAMQTMAKLDIQALKDAHEGRQSP